MIPLRLGAQHSLVARPRADTCFTIGDRAPARPDLVLERVE
jgi:hypothetical protein